MEFVVEVLNLIGLLVVVVAIWLMIINMKKKSFFYRFGQYEIAKRRRYTRIRR